MYQLIGLPGCGKSTIAERLAKEFNLNPLRDAFRVHKPVDTIVIEAEGSVDEVVARILGEVERWTRT